MRYNEAEEYVKRTNKMAMIERPCGDCPFKASELLTPRQREAVEYIAKGMSNKEVASHMNVSVGTVKMMLHLVYEKTGLKNRTELALTFTGKREAAHG